MTGLRDRQRPAARQPRHQPRIAGHQDADDQPGAEQHVRQVVGAEIEMNFDRVSGLMTL